MHALSVPHCHYKVSLVVVLSVADFPERAEDQVLCKSHFGCGAEETCQRGWRGFGVGSHLAEVQIAMGRGGQTILSGARPDCLDPKSM